MDAKRTIIFIVRFLFFWFVVASVASVALNEARGESRTTLEDGTFILWADIMKSRGVPKEITDHSTILSLVSGRVETATVRSTAEVTRVIDFPSIKKVATYKEYLVTYKNGEWSVKPFGSKSTEPVIDVFESVFFLFVMSVLILIANITIVWKRLKVGFASMRCIFLIAAVFVLISLPEGRTKMLIDYLIFLFVVELVALGIALVVKSAILAQNSVKGLTMVVDKSEAD